MNEYKRIIYVIKDAINTLTLAFLHALIGIFYVIVAIVMNYEKDISEVPLEFAFITSIMSAMFVIAIVWFIFYIFVKFPKVKETISEIVYEKGVEKESELQEG